MVAGYARDVPRQIIEQAAESDEPGLRSLLCEWALESEKNSSIRAMVTLLKSEPGIRVEADALDRNPWLLNVKNGTLDLKTGKLLSHNPGDLITKMAGASFDPDAQCPRWERFILEVMDGDEDLAGYLRRFSGYALTASTKEQAFLFFSGIGANGKGRFVETIAHILGDYAAPLSPAALTVKYGDTSTNEWAGLRGIRYAYCGEVEPGKVLDSALIKGLTGEDTMRVRHLYREYFSLRPCFKLVYSANGMPKVRDTSYGFWRRCKHVPFNVSFSGEKRDPHLQDKLNVEASGILNWCLSGLSEWLSGGLNEPGIVSAATREYRDDQSVVRAFLDEMTVKIPTHSVLLQKLHEVFLEWAKRNGERNLSNRALKKELEQNGMTTKRGMYGVLVENVGIVNTEN
jgi:putative DNA primase/helicase